jgi:hypothetical protein
MRKTTKERPADRKPLVSSLEGIALIDGTREYTLLDRHSPIVQRDRVPRFVGSRRAADPLQILATLELRPSNLHQTGRLL